MIFRPGQRRPRCAVKGCVRAVSSLGLCLSHYERQRRTGSPFPAKTRRVAGRKVVQSDGKPLCDYTYEWVHPELRTTEPDPPVSS